MNWHSLSVFFSSLRPRLLKEILNCRSKRFIHYGRFSSQPQVFTIPKHGGGVILNCLACHFYKAHLGEKNELYAATSVLPTLTNHILILHIAMKLKY